METSAEHGDPKDGCANLAVTGSLALPATVSVGDQLSIANVTKHVGSGTAGASTTRYYLSKDGQKSKDDVRLIGSQAIPTLFAGGEFSPTPPTSVIIPPIAPGSYTLLDCADDLAAVTETTAKDNCFHGSDGHGQGRLTDLRERQTYGVSPDVARISS